MLCANPACRGFASLHPTKLCTSCLRAGVRLAPLPRPKPIAFTPPPPASTTPPLSRDDRGLVERCTALRAPPPIAPGQPEPPPVTTASILLCVHGCGRSFSWPAARARHEAACVPGRRIRKRRPAKPKPPVAAALAPASSPIATPAPAPPPPLPPPRVVVEASPRLPGRFARGIPELCAEPSCIRDGVKVVDGRPLCKRHASRLGAAG